MNAVYDIIPDVEGCNNEEESDSDRLDSNPERSDYPCPICHTDFVNKKEVIEHMEICSGTYPEPKRLNLICTYCKQTFATNDKIEMPIAMCFNINLGKYFIHKKDQHTKVLILCLKTCEFVV